MEKIDVRAVIRQKYKGYIPSFVFRWIERLIRQDELNEINATQRYVDGVRAAKEIITYLDQKVEVVGAHRLPPLEERTLFVSNHPLGGADGIIYTALLGMHYQRNIALLVNDVLLNLTQFSDVFVPVNKYGTQGRERTNLIEEALQSDKQVFTFPAGLCSRQGADKAICDLEWKTSFIRMAQRSQRNVVPLYFDGINSRRFYNWARCRERLGIKFNYELILLPDEFIRSRGKTFRIYVGEPIPYEGLPTGKEMRTFANALRDDLYNFPKRYAEEPVEILHTHPNTSPPQP